MLDLMAWSGNLVPALYLLVYSFILFFKKRSNGVIGWLSVGVAVVGFRLLLYM